MHELGLWRGGSRYQDPLKAPPNPIVDSKNFGHKIVKKVLLHPQIMSSDHDLMIHAKLDCVL
jgi:hypothetical protein